MTTNSGKLMQTNERDWVNDGTAHTGVATGALDAVLEVHLQTNQGRQTQSQIGQCNRSLTKR